MKTTNLNTFFTISNLSYLDNEEAFSNENIDINDKYHLNIIVPIIWSFIIFFGIFGKNQRSTFTQIDKFNEFI
jgi:hypothetical protein